MKRLVMIKRIIAVVLAFLLVGTYLPYGVANSVSANDKPVNGTFDGGATRGIVGNYVDWTDTDSLPSEPGNYSLLNNVDLTEEWQVPDGTVNLNLNGKTIKQTDNTNRVIYIGKDSELNLFDESGSGKITGGRTEENGAGVYVAGTFVMDGGIISGNRSDGIGGGVFVKKNAEFTLNAGAVKNNRANAGAGVGIGYKGIFTMNDGSIENNSFEWLGGGVYVSGNFIMKDGSISDNQNLVMEDFGGGVYVYDFGVFSMEGGSITGNNSENGGGVFLDEDTTFDMTGGCITENNAEYEAGGVYVCDDAEFNVEGDAFISENLKDDFDDSNVFLDVDYNSINITDSLSEDAIIGITEKNISNAPVTYGLKGNGDSSNFTSDNELYMVALNKSKEVVLGEPVILTFDPGEGTGEAYEEPWIKGLDYLLPECEFGALPGYEFKEWQIGDDIENLKKAGSKVRFNNDTTITARFARKVFVSFDANGGSGSMDTVSMPEGTEYTLPECEFGVPEYTLLNAEFIGWKVGDSNTIYDEGDKVTIESDTVISAQWEFIYPLWIGGVQVLESNRNDILGDGTVRFVPEYDSENDFIGGTLTLDNLNGLSDCYNNGGLIYSEGMDLKITGTGKVFGKSGTEAGDANYGIYLKGSGNNTLTLNGNIEAQAETFGIINDSSGGKIVIEGGSLVARGIPNGYAIYSMGDIIVHNGITNIQTVGGEDILIFRAFHGKIVLDEELLIAIPEGGKIRTLAGSSEITDSSGGRPDNIVIRPKEQYTIHFASGEGTGTMQDVTVSENDKYTLPQCDFSAPQGKNFVGWQIGSDMENLKLPGEKIKISDNSTITACWTEGDYVDIRFDANGGSGNMETVSLISGQSYLIPACDFEKPDLGSATAEFIGWKMNGSDRIYEAGEPVTIDSNTVFTAQWEKYYPLWTGGVRVSESNCKDILNDGTLQFTPDYNSEDKFIGGTLRLNNLDGLEDAYMNALIYAKGMDLTVTGTGKIIGKNGTNAAEGIYLTDTDEDSGHPLTLDGNFQVEGMTYGIMNNSAGGGIYVESGSLSVEGTQSPGYAIYASGPITVKNEVTRVEATGREGTQIFKAFNGTINLGSDIYIVTPEGGIIKQSGSSEYIADASGGRPQNIVLLHRNKHTVRFEAGGGSGEMESVTVFGDEEFSLPECDFNAPKFSEFLGWKVGNDTELKSEGESVEIDSDTVVTAQWKMNYPIWVGGVRAEESNLTDILGDGTVSFTPEYSSENEFIGGTLEFNNPDALEGEHNGCLIYTEGINLTISGTGKIYGKSGTDAENAMGIRIKDLNSSGHTLTLNGNIQVEAASYAIYNGSTEGNTILQGGSISAKAKDADDYAFYAFSGNITINNEITKVEATGRIRAFIGTINIGDKLYIATPDGGKIETLASSDSIVDASGETSTDTVIKPKEKYTIRFKSGRRDEEMPPVTVYRGDAYVLPECVFEAPEGKTFAGWQMNDETDELKPVGETIIITDNVVLTAAWGDLKTPKFAGYTLSLNGDIAVNFFVDVGDADMKGAKVHLTWNMGDTIVDLSRVDSQYYKATCNVAAKEMTDDITATLIMDDEVVDENTYSVAEYAYTILEDKKNEYSDVLKKLVRNMLIYGAKSQLQFNYNTNKLADYQLGEYTIDAVDADELRVIDYSEVNFGSYGLTFEGTMMNLNTNTDYKLYFKPVKNAQIAQVKLGDRVITPTEDGDYLCYTIAGLAAKNITDDIVLTFNGDEITFNTGNYINSALEKDETLQTTVTALYNYNQAAIKYFNQ